MISRPVALAALTLTLAIGTARPSGQSPVLQTAMREKLSNTQGLLEAVVRADFDAVSTYTDRLSRINEQEVALWQTPSRPGYAEQATRLLTAVQGLRQAAAARDLRALGTEYSNLVSSCVGCHSYLRESQPAPGR